MRPYITIFDLGVDRNETQKKSYRNACAVRIGGLITDVFFCFLGWILGGVDGSIIGLVVGTIVFSICIIIADILYEDSVIPTIEQFNESSFRSNSDLKKSLIRTKDNNAQNKRVR